MTAQQPCVFNGQRDDPGGLRLMPRAHNVQRIAVAVVGIDHQRQPAGAVDAQRLGGEFRLELTRFRGHPSNCVRGVHHGRAVERRPLAGGAGTYPNLRSWWDSANFA